MTGPQDMLFAGDPGIAADIAREKADAEALLAAASRGHARTRTSRFRFPWQPRGETPAPLAGSQLLAAPDDEPGDFTQAIGLYESEAEPYGEEAFARPAAREPREHEAAGRILAERADPRPYAPPAISAIPWGMWDTGASEPVRPVYVPDLPADLTDLPAFRETLSRRTRRNAGECLCGDPVAGQTWGERMVSAGDHMFSLPAGAAFTFPAATDEYRARLAEESIEAYDVLYPVPEALAPEAEQAGGQA